MRNSTMSDKLTSALATSRKLHAIKPKSKEEIQRQSRLQRSFQPRLYTAPVVEPEPEPVEEPEPVVEPKVEEPAPSVIEPTEEPHPEQIEQALEAIAKHEEPPQEEPQNHLSSDLSSPFAPSINAMVGRLKDAKNSLGFTLSEALKREVQKLADLEVAKQALAHEQDLIAELRAKMAKLDDTIGGCSLLESMSAEISDMLVTTNGHAKTAAPHVPKLDFGDRGDPRRLSINDIRKFFDANPNTNWHAQEIVKAMPLGKQAHARVTISQFLFQAMKEGTIKRMSQGVYRLDRVQ